MNSPSRAYYRQGVSENTRILALLSPSRRYFGAILQCSRQVPLKIHSGEYSGRKRWRQHDRIAQLFEAADVVALEACRIALVEIISAQVCVGLALTHEGRQDDEDAMGQRENRSALATPARHAMVERDLIGARGTG
jgi:hypothetical protein